MSQMMEEIRCTKEEICHMNEEIHQLRKEVPQEE